MKLARSTAPLSGQATRRLHLHNGRRELRKDWHKVSGHSERDEPQGRKASTCVLLSKDLAASETTTRQCSPDALLTLCTKRQFKGGGHESIKTAAQRGTTAILQSHSINATRRGNEA